MKVEHWIFFWFARFAKHYEHLALCLSSSSAAAPEWNELNIPESLRDYKPETRKLGRARYLGFILLQNRTSRRCSFQVKPITKLFSFQPPHPKKNEPAGAPNIARLRYSAIPISVCPPAQQGPKISLKQVTHGMRRLCGNPSAFNLR